MRKGRPWPFLKQPLFTPNQPFNSIAPIKCFFEVRGDWNGHSLTGLVNKTEAGSIDFGTPCLTWFMPLGTGPFGLQFQIQQIPLNDGAHSLRWVMSGTDSAGNSMVMHFDFPLGQIAWLIFGPTLTTTIDLNQPPWSVTGDWRVWPVTWPDFP